MNVTLNSVLGWDAIPGALFQVQVKDGVDAVQVAAYDVGADNFVTVGDLLAGLSGTSFKFAVRSVLPGGVLPSAWSPDLSVTLIGFPVPANLTII